MIKLIRELIIHDLDLRELTLKRINCTFHAILSRISESLQNDKSKGAQELANDVRKPIDMVLLTSHCAFNVEMINRL